MRTGNSNIRNPVLISYVAKGLLPYHGLGSGIQRALELWSDIDFKNDYEGSLFTVTINRKPTNELSILELERLPGKSTQILQDAPDAIVELIRNKPDISISELTYLTGTTERTVKRLLQKLADAGTIRRNENGSSWVALK
jgi:ATP-dependent DNA helicase RecG